MSGFVMVELVCDRQEHKDTMYGTEVIWPRRGSIRQVPEDAWRKMKIHADVYKLVGERAPDALSLATSKIAEAASTGTDMVVVDTTNAPAVDTSGPWTEERVAAASADDLRAAAASYGRSFHKRMTNVETMRKAFLQMIGEGETS